ncbi:MAG: MATE family efflux transporter [Coriobacteriales bacterium]|jgi:putative MATE family efflux protein|nr:MATE family efflux transporter [Coriobacteriales bacterium]
MSNPRRDEPVSDDSRASNENTIQAEPVLLQTGAILELDLELELDAREDDDYTPDEPVSKRGMQYAPKKSPRNTTESDTVDRMGTAPLGKLILEFAIPSIISMVVNGSYNVIDSIFLGQSLGETGLATVTIASPIMTMSMAVAVLVGAGGNALMAIKLGEGKRETAVRVMGNTFILALTLALICTLAVFLFMDPLLVLSGSTEAIHDSARSFVAIIAAGFVFQFLGMGFNNFMRTAGNPRGALYVMLTGMAVSILLNYILVMVMGFGVVGSALATIAGMLVTCCGVLYYFIWSKSAPFKLQLHAMKPNPRLMANICVLGSASFFLQVAVVVINFLLNNQLVYYGAMDPIGSEGALAAIGVMIRISMFVFFPILGVSIAVQPLLGYNYGAKLYARVKKTFLFSLVWVLSFGVFFWLLVHIFPTQIVELFGVHEALHDFTIKAIQVMMLVMPFAGLQVLSAGYFQATGQPLKSMFISLTRQLLYLVPLLYFLPTIVQQLALAITPLESLYYAYPIADILSIFTAGIMMLVEWRRLARLQEKQQSTKAGGSLAGTAAA